VLPSNVELLREEQSVRGVQPGTGNITLGGYRSTVRVLDSDESIMKLEPIVAALRLSHSDPAQDRLAITDVTLDIISRLFYPQERAEVTASVVLYDGRRVVISDPSLLMIRSSNESVVQVENNYIVANGSGNATLEVSFIVCDMQLSTSMIEVSVQFDQHTPQFEPEIVDAEIIENSLMGSVITQVVATDSDFAEGESTDTEYRLQEDLYNGLFTVNARTGQLLLNGHIDRETRDVYEVVIEATDRVQRLIEANARPTGGCSGGSGYGSGSGGSGCDPDDLIPDPQPPILPHPSLELVALPDSILVSHAHHIHVPLIIHVYMY